MQTRILQWHQGPTAHHHKDRPEENSEDADGAKDVHQTKGHNRGVEAFGHVVTTVGALGGHYQVVHIDPLENQLPNSPKCKNLEAAFCVS